jgi:hypothetical protein
MGPELRIIYPPTTISGLAGLLTYLQEGVWYIDPSNLEISIAGAGGIIASFLDGEWTVDGSTILEILTTASGDIISQFPTLAGYATESWANNRFIDTGEMTTISGDIILQIPSLAAYATQSWVNAGFPTNTKLTTTSGDIVTQIPSLANYVTLNKLTTASGDIVSQIPSLAAYATQAWTNLNFIDNTEMTTISGDIIAQIPSLASYSTQVWVSGKLTTTSGDIVAQIPSLAGYATQTWVNALLTTASGDLAAQIPTLEGTGGIVTTKEGNVWNVDGSNLIGGGGGGAGGNNTVSGTAGENLAPFDTVYESITDGLFYKAFRAGQAYQADAIGMVTHPITIETGLAGEITLEGSVMHDSWTWTPGKPLYVGSTPGTLVDTPTTTSGEFNKPVAQAITEIRIWVHPELGWEVGGIYDQVIITQQQGQKGDPGPVGPASQVPGPVGPQVTYISLQGTAGETLAQYDVVYQDYADSGKYKIAVCSDLAKADACGMVIQPGGITNGNAGSILIWGYITDASWNWTAGKGLFLSSSSGNFMQDEPTTSGYYAKPLGRTPTTSGIWFNSELGWLIN